jgi:hypothetical protein
VGDKYNAYSSIYNLTLPSRFPTPQIRHSLLDYPGYKHCVCSRYIYRAYRHVSTFHMALGSTRVQRTLWQLKDILSLARHAKPPPGRGRGRDAHATALQIADACIQEGIPDVDIRDGCRVSQAHFATIGPNISSASALSRSLE